MSLIQLAARDLATAARAMREAGRALESFMQRCDQILEACGKEANDGASIVNLDAMRFELKKAGCAVDLQAINETGRSWAIETAPCLDEAARIMQRLSDWQRHVEAQPELAKTQSSKAKHAEEALACVSSLSIVTDALAHSISSVAPRVGEVGKQMKSAKLLMSLYATQPYAEFSKSVKAKVKAQKAAAAVKATGLHSPAPSVSSVLASPATASMPSVMASPVPAAVSATA